MNYNEICWQTGNYSDLCECEFCEHKHECSGYEEDEQITNNPFANQVKGLLILLY